MNQEKKPQNLNINEKKDTPLKWERKVRSKGVFDLIQPILGNFVLLIEEERKRTIEKMERAKKVLERMKNNR